MTLVLSVHLIDGEPSASLASYVDNFFCWAWLHVSVHSLAVISG